MLMWHPHGRTIPVFTGMTSRGENHVEGNSSLFILYGRERKLMNHLLVNTSSR